MISHRYIEEYISKWKNGEIILNERRIKLIGLIEKEILCSDDMYFDEEQIENYVKFTEKYFFPLTSTQKFKTCFIFLFYKYTDRLVFTEHFDYEGRGGGKTGRISSLANYFISHLHGINEYSVSVVANSEDQAKMSFDEVYNVIDEDDNLKKFFKHKKSIIESNLTKASFKYRTSNANTKDGLRDGAVIFEEVHAYENANTVNVFSSGLGKIKYPRKFFVGTDGYVRDGFIDKLKERADAILNGDISIREMGLFPFMCNLDNEEEMHDSDMWQKSNSQFHPPLSDYALNLFQTIESEYKALAYDSTGYEEFVTKRMNLPKVNMEQNVASWEKIKATEQQYDLEELKNRECIGVLDYASIRDFVATGLFFVKGEKYYLPKEVTQSFVCKPFVDKHYGYSQKKGDGNNKQDHRQFAPIREWEEKGLLTVIDKETMDPQIIIDWFVHMRDVEGYMIKKIIADNYRMELLKPLFEKVGFEVEVIRNPDAASALLSPRIELAFEQENVIFGANPMMRWYTNNVLVVINNSGNKLYKKKEAVKRKTDGFMAFLYGMWAARDLDNYDINDTFELLDYLDF